MIPTFLVKLKQLKTITFALLEGPIQFLIID